MAPIRFHLSLNVSNLERSVAFYRTLFGLEPAKCRPDYAKFELEDPPVVFSLEPASRGQGGALNHLGFRVSDAATLVAMQQRLEAAGLPSQREEGVECCYSRQTKFWVHDPDRTLWEVYTLDGEIEHRGAGQSVEKVLPQEQAKVQTEPVIWEHRMAQEVPDRIPLADGSVDEVRLRGSFNLPLRKEEQTHLLDEAARVLRPSGRLFIHVLTAARPLAGPPTLPGPASVVRHVPVASDILALAQAAGFQALRLTKFDDQPCFVREGVPMRQTMMEGWKQEKSTAASSRVIYKGPFREIRDDQGTAFPRGEWVAVDAATAERLRAPELAGQFLVLDAQGAATAVPDCGAST